LLSKKIPLRAFFYVQVARIPLVVFKKIVFWRLGRLHQRRPSVLGGWKNGEEFRCLTIAFSNLE
jgi:hypothetical protein